MGSAVLLLWAAMIGPCLTFRLIRYGLEWAKREMRP